MYIKTVQLSENVILRNNLHGNFRFPPRIKGLKSCNTLIYYTIQYSPFYLIGHFQSLSSSYTIFPAYSILDEITFCQSRPAILLIISKAY